MPHSVTWHRAISPEDETSWSRVFSSATVLTNAGISPVADEQQDNVCLSLSSVSLPHLASPPLWLAVITSLLGCFRSCMWSVALQSLETLRQRHTHPVFKTWTEAGETAQTLTERKASFPGHFRQNRYLWMKQLYTFLSVYSDGTTTQEEVVRWPFHW